MTYLLLSAAITYISLYWSNFGKTRSHRKNCYSAIRICYNAGYFSWQSGNDLELAFEGDHTKTRRAEAVAKKAQDGIIRV